MPAIHHFKNWKIERSGPGLRVSGKRSNEHGEHLFNNDKISGLAYVAKSESGQLAGFDKTGVVKVYLDV